MKNKTCCFTGHRLQRFLFGLNEKDARCCALKKTLREEIIRLIEKEDVRHFISGMSIGIDMYAAEIVLDVKKDHPDITLECAIPCETQAANWTEAQRERYYSIAAQCDKETILQAHYTHDCMEKRNKYMVDQSDVIIAVCSGSSGGTGKTVDYAMTKGKSVIISYV